MNHGINKAEEQFRDLAESLEVDINTNDLWASVEPQLKPEKKKRRGFIWWWVGVAALLLGVIIAKDNISFQTEKEVPLPVIPARITEVSPVGVIEKQNEKEVQPGIEKRRSQTPLRKKLSKHKNIPVRPIASPPALKSVDKQSEPNNKIEAVTQIHLDEAAVVVDYPVVSSIAGIKQELKWTNNELPDVGNLKITNHRSRRWFISFASGINQNWSAVRMDNPEVVDSRFAFETDLYGISTELMAGIQKGKWSLALGGSYSLQTTGFTQHQTVVEQEVVQGTTTTFIDGDGEKTDMYGNVLQTTINRYDILWHRIHREIDAQVEIGRALFHHGRWSITVYTGLGYNLWASHRGYYFEENMQSITKLTGEVPSPYRKKGGLKYNGAIGLNYQLGNIQLGITPYFKYSNYSILENTFYTLKNSQYGLQLRMVYRPQ